MSRRYLGDIHNYPRSHGVGPENTTAKQCPKSDPTPNLQCLRSILNEDIDI